MRDRSHPLELLPQAASARAAAGTLLFSSGYLANLTVATALAAVLGAPNDLLIVSDAGNHALARPFKVGTR